MRILIKIAIDKSKENAKGNDKQLDEIKTILSEHFNELKNNDQLSSHLTIEIDLIKAFRFHCLNRT